MNILMSPALAALAEFPQLQAQCAPALEAQARRIAERSATAVPRPAALAGLAAELRGGRLIALEGPAGSGITTLLCALAAQHPYAFWLPEDDAGAGLAALCAQVLALGRLAPTLLPPAAGRDGLTLERLLAEAGAARASGDPLVVLIGRRPDHQATPLPPPFPALVPPGVAIALACAPGEALPYPADVVIRPSDHRQLLAAARAFGAAPELAAAIAAQADGSFLYARLAARLCARGTLPASDLPAGLAALHSWWWERSEPDERRLALLLSAAGAPLEPALLASVAGMRPAALRAWSQRWRALLTIEAGRVWLYHPATRAFVRRQSGDELAEAHAAFVRLARGRAGESFEKLSVGDNRYLIDQLARHVALSPAEVRAVAGPELATRGWAVARERVSGGLGAAARDMAWVLRVDVERGSSLLLVRHAMLAGLLAYLGRQLPPGAPAAAFEAAVQQGGQRDTLLRRVREALGQLPEGAAKAQALRRLGEVCYALRMRASAMRMLSEALDLETPGPSRQWRDEREEALVAFARAAIAIDMPQTALGITARIGHAERRGMIETEVVRWLLVRDQRTRAEEVAYAIGHTPMHEWAMAEVAVGHVRAGDYARGETVLSTLRTETAVAWARTELACDAARHGQSHALGQLAPLQNAGLLDRALALVAQALAAGGHPEAALEAARTAGDRAIRARALIELAHLHALNAPTALAEAAAELAELSGDERAPLVAELAAAQATFGPLETALRTTELLGEDEERDRAQSRVAVALARTGNADDARIVAEAIGDDDERDWAFDELARLAAAGQRWDEALQLAQEIVAGQQRARTIADLAIAQARAGYAAAGHALAGQIELAAERMRALVTIAEPLLAQAQPAVALAQIDQLNDPDQRARYQVAVASALATHGTFAGAGALAHAIVRPLERARALAAVAAVAAPTDRALARRAVGEALQIAAGLGRDETLKCLAWATGTLAQLGGAELLLAAASAIEEVDSWWT